MSSPRIDNTRSRHVSSHNTSRAHNAKRAAKSSSAEKARSGQKLDVIPQNPGTADLGSFPISVDDPRIQVQQRAAGHVTLDAGSLPTIPGEQAVNSVLKQSGALQSAPLEPQRSSTFDPHKGGFPDQHWRTESDSTRPQSSQPAGMHVVDIEGQAKALQAQASQSLQTVGKHTRNLIEAQQLVTGPTNRASHTIAFAQGALGAASSMVTMAEGMESSLYSLSMKPGNEALQKGHELVGQANMLADPDLPKNIHTAAGMIRNLKKSYAAFQAANSELRRSMSSANPGDKPFKALEKMRAALGAMNRKGAELTEFLQRTGLESQCKGIQGFRKARMKGADALVRMAESKLVGAGAGKWAEHVGGRAGEKVADVVAERLAASALEPEHHQHTGAASE